jgi:hypothetical protein
VSGCKRDWTRYQVWWDGENTRRRTWVERMSLVQVNATDKSMPVMIVSGGWMYAATVAGGMPYLGAMVNGVRQVLRHAWARSCT